MKAIAMGVALTLSSTVLAEEFDVTRNMHCAEDPNVGAGIVEENGFAPFITYSEQMTLVHNEQGPIKVDGETMMMLNDQNQVISFWVIDNGSFYCLNTLGQNFQFEATGL